jgi:phosphoglycolate phosphatase-like HAD superfamily hydrolase
VDQPEQPWPAHWWVRCPPLSAGPAVVFDLDGVLSDARGRQHLLRGERRDWRAFFDACGEDPVVVEGARLLELVDPGLTVVLLTGRPLRVRPQTLRWLDRHQLRWDLLVMRPGSEWAPAVAFKAQALAELRQAGLDPRLAVEDDPRNRAMFEAAGVPCVYFHSGYYD